jgi:hypothetical protein
MHHNPFSKGRCINLSCSCGCGGKIRNNCGKQTPVRINVRVGKTRVSVQTCAKRKRRQPNSCCSDSHLRPPGIKFLRRTTTGSGIYFADADLECSGLCTGKDRDIVYSWTLIPTNPQNPGGLSIVGGGGEGKHIIKTGNDQVEIAGTGAFDLKVLVRFDCTFGDLHFLCDRDASVKFVQQ